MSGPLNRTPMVVRKKPKPFEGRCFIGEHSGLRKIARRLRKPDKNGNYLTAMEASESEKKRHVHPKHLRGF